MCGACLARSDERGEIMSNMLKKVFSRENLIALALCLLIIALLIATADSSPQWIYQGF
jgi:hypothetical protein